MTRTVIAAHQALMSQYLVTTAGRVPTVVQVSIPTLLLINIQCIDEIEIGVAANFNHLIIDPSSRLKAMLEFYAQLACVYFYHT